MSDLYTNKSSLKIIRCLTGSQCRIHKRGSGGHGGLGKQDGQPSSEDVGDELIGYLVLKKEVHCHLIQLPIGYTQIVPSVLLVCTNGETTALFDSSMI